MFEMLQCFLQFMSCFVMCSKIIRIRKLQQMLNCTFIMGSISFRTIYSSPRIAINNSWKTCFKTSSSCWSAAAMFYNVLNLLTRFLRRKNNLTLEKQTMHEQQHTCIVCNDSFPEAERVGCAFPRHCVVTTLRRGKTPLHKQADDLLGSACRKDLCFPSCPFAYPVPRSRGVSCCALQALPVEGSGSIAPLPAGVTVSARCQVELSCTC